MLPNRAEQSYASFRREVNIAAGLLLITPQSDGSKTIVVMTVRSVVKKSFLSQLLDRAVKVPQNLLLRLLRRLCLFVAIVLVSAHLDGWSIIASLAGR